MHEPGSEAWHAQVREAIVDPERPIIDTHHHLWRTPTVWGRYELDDLRRDTESGHRIVATVFVECRSDYRRDGPEHLRPVGETEYVRAVAEASGDRPRIAAIVANADLTLGAAVEEVLIAHEQAAGGRFRGIRYAGARDDTGTLRHPGRPYPCPYGRPEFLEGLRTLGRLGYTYDAWHFFHQNRDFLDVARAVPDTTLVLNHFGTPLGVGAYAGRQEEIFATWREDIAAIAECPNVVAKLGGLAMPDNGFGWHEAARPPTSDEFVAAQRRWYEHAIACFGPDRCLFESNFPVDRLSVSAHVLWNALKKIAAPYSDAEQDAMFRRTAARVYRIDLDP